MYKQLPIIILSVFLHCSQNIYSQSLRQFSDDTGMLTGELIKIMGSNLSDSQLTQLSKFTGLWDSGILNTQEKHAIIKTANLFLLRNARPVPHFINYLEILICFAEHDPFKKHYPVWEKAFINMLIKSDISLQRINDFVIFTNHLISQNLLYKSNAVTWKADNSNYYFVFDDSLHIFFNETSLEGFSHNDTLRIHKTAGRLCPLSYVWTGKGGRVTWERAGLEHYEAYAILSSYIVNLDRIEYQADSVLLNFNRYFDSPLIGRLTDRIMSTINTSDANYPEFTSYRQQFIIKDIYQDVDYEGGLSMQGAKMVGSGGEEGDARLFFYLDGEKWLTAESSHFVFRPHGTNSLNTRVVLILDNDSVFHPNVHLNYVDKTRELSLNQNQKVISRSPWDNQFHQVDMSFAQLMWKTDERELSLTMPRASSLGNASFQSHNFFDINLYQRLQGRDATHPLLTLRNFSELCKCENISAEEYSKFLRRPLSSIRHQLLEMTLQGFIYYDTETDLIRIRKRLFDYLHANINKIDYDIINFTSTTKPPIENAILDLNSFDMQINGIPIIYLSNYQRVNVYPGNNTVTLKRNRNFLFDGTVNSGNLSFHGNSFLFDYDDFSINLQNVDSVSMRVKLDKTDSYGQARFTNVRNIIRNITGELNIDKPDNKSGRIDYPDLPKFTSTGNSYVFFEKPQIQNGAYRSEDFYFELDPFVMDSLNTFRNEKLSFNGKLISAGIFPVIEEVLTLQEDYSIGITHSISPEGMPVYGGKGIYYHNIQLSNDGLKGSGKLNFLTAELHSEDFLFLPDSMNAVTSDFIIQKQTTGIEFPAVNSKNNIVQWFPEKEVMKVSQTDYNFALFDDQTELKGALNISSSGLSGSGSIILGKASISSELFLFGTESFSADFSNFMIHDPDKPELSLSSSGLSTNFSMKDRNSRFSLNKGDEMVYFPSNSYIANPESFIWDMDKQELEFFSSAINPETGLKGAEFISTERPQDSLSFISPRAILDYKTNLLKAYEVKQISVADATIFPYSETITIGENAMITDLKDARIVANREQSYHEIYNATVKIDGSNEYRGSGDYDYVDEFYEIQRIHFDEISVSNDFETITSGTIKEQDNFMLNPRFSFTGNAGLTGSRPHLRFKGATRISHNCEGITDQWLAFEDEIDPMQVMIPVPDQPMSINRERIYSGIFVASDSAHLYPAFFSKRKNYADQLLLTADGYMIFDPAIKEYRIAPLDILKNPDIPGNYLILNPDKCILAGEGKLELGVTLGQLKIDAFGSATNEMNINETSLNGIITLNFLFSDDALAFMAKQALNIQGYSIDSSAYYFTRGLNHLLGQERANIYRSGRGRELIQSRLPEELAKTFVLSDVNLKWNQARSSYQSHGKIGVAYINGVRVNKMFTGYLEITKLRSGDMLDFYIELDENNWYYFGYTRGVMQAFSSNSDFVTIINDLPLRLRRLSVPSNETRYIYMLATDTKLNQFLNTYRRQTENRNF